MPYQHFFMFHDVTWARQSKQASSALALLAVARYAFDSDVANLLETNTNLE